jgi:hypothetical protein
MMRRVPVVVALLLSCLSVAGRAHAASPAVGSVSFIRHGLQVRPPGKSSHAGKVKMSLFQRYELHTGTSDQASIGFSDGTVMHMNAQTDAVLTSPHVTTVHGGEVDEDLAPGADHQVQTSAAIASAIGTNFLVRIVGPASYFMVLHGAVQVSNPYGTVVVKHDQGSLVIPGQPPQPAYPVDAGTATSWINTMPVTHLPENVALDASGGTIAGFSSQYVASSRSDYGPFPFGLAANLIDGRLDVGWESATGQPSNQWVKVGLPGAALYTVSEVLIDPAATQGDPAASDLKDFQILVSTATSADADFHVVLSGTCSQSSALQKFGLPAGTKARYVEIKALDNYGDPSRIAVAELEVVSPSP